MLRKFSVLVLAVGVFLSPFSLPSHFSSAADGSEEILGYTEWSGEKIIDGTVYIDPLATLVIKKGTVITFRNWSVMDIQGKLRIEGTVKEPVILQKDSDLPDTMYSLQISNQGEVMIRNADISGGGSVAYQVQNKKQNIFFNTANAGSYTGVIHWQGGKSLVAENVSFHDNTAAVYIENQSPAAKIQVHRSRFLNNEYDVLNARTGSVDFRYNWWGDASGSQKMCAACAGYEKISGAVDIADWAKQADTKDPVIVVPGILGSEKKNNQWIINPALHVYDDLYQSLIENGYTEGKDLIVFPYEWRDSNIDNATLLKDKINQVKSASHWPKVDIVAHSMGGLLARQYVESDQYADDIDQLITLGTPQEGAPVAYLRWERGLGLFSLQEVLLNYQFQLWAEHDGFDSIFHYIRNRPVSSLQELLSVDSYLYDIKNDNTLVQREYPDNYPRNIFLESLNTSEKVKRLEAVEFTKIIGRLGNNESTISAFNVIDSDKGEYWEYGYPNDIESLIGDKGIKFSDGDGTVPLESAKSIPSDQEIEINASHLNLPSKAADTVYTVLTGFDSIANISPLIINSILFVPVFSPIDIQLVSPSGERIGKNFETNGEYNEISGAFYTGYDTENEFITVPNPEDGEYRILTQGTGDGDYRIEAVKITEGATPSDEAKESVATFAGTATTGATEEKKIEIIGDEVQAVEDNDIIPPTTEASLSGTQGLNGWYTSDVTVTLSAEDNENGSGVEKTEYSLDNGTVWNVYADPLALSQEGTTTIQYFSTDKQDNQEAAKTLTVNIDKTAPEAKIVFNPTTQKLDIIGTDNLNQAVAVSMAEPVISDPLDIRIRSWFRERFRTEKERKARVTATLTDQAGHVTEIIFENKQDNHRRIDISLVSIAYDGVKILLPKTLLQYTWYTDWRQPYHFFIAHLRTETTLLGAYYLSRTNETWLLERPRDRHDDEWRPIWKKLPGMVVPGVMTEQGKVNIKY